ncbi:host-nuclease inhibitor Gam family protein [Thiothrix nivea]|uniref:Mu Gam family protein n=1 Tax=Thiothrix nivea (strain ATCC 35100 / DSM 5205 / JP2) TaxID=870187 RepID=A0A656HAS8_THINJ|nr:host-nuclease inhibitor Gam family protein [Thiothrix nivea]EIJ33343.1 Mu Gam family protein [Thiothrix nivea DSM 5205]
MARTKTVAVAAATSLEEAEKKIQRLGEVQREISRLEHDMNDELNPIKEKYENQAKPFKDELNALQTAIQMWAETNKPDLLTGKAKTVKCATGDFGWRTSTPSVRITGVAVVLERLKQLALLQFIRTKEEINKEAILANPKEIEHVKGITIAQSESFWIKPFGSEIEVEGVVK